MKPFLLVAMGGALGSLGRYAVGLAATWAGTSFPLGTLLVNVLGCFLIGLALAAGWASDQPLRLLLVTGFLGGFTTFSAFGGETIELFRAAAPARALLNIGANVLLGLLATWLGFSLVK